MPRRFSQIVVRVYANKFPKEGPDGVEFHSPDPVVFMMWLVETLSDLQKKVLRNMRLPERTPILRITYRFLAMLPDRSCRYRILDTRTATPGAGTSNLAPDVEAPTIASPVDVVPPHEHTGETESKGEDVDAMGEDRLTDIWGGGDDYNLDGGVELQLGHRFCSREAVHMGVKNYSIRRATEYKQLELENSGLLIEKLTLKSLLIDKTVRVKSKEKERRTSKNFEKVNHAIT
ncbi:hypothetical protein PIB30_063930 [Stylosanthes scabra]|uniref:Uncharacterized protein n=1 Tax=Stylosanthes scabra TaxID=79078 RepID=A0ABU6YJ27_9FABA|nr:hypothetical protein [Stylosanthes scabra]